MELRLTLSEELAQIDGGLEMPLGFSQTVALHDELSEKLAQGQSVDSTRARSLIDAVIQNSPTITYIEERKKLRSILRFWASYLSARDEELPDLDIDSFEQYITNLESYSQIEHQVYEIKTIPSVLQEEQISKQGNNKRGATSELQEILTLHNKLSEELEQSRSVDISNVKKIIDRIQAHSSAILYVEERHKLRSILRFWASYLLVQREELPEFEIASFQTPPWPQSHERPKAIQPKKPGERKIYVNLKINGEICEVLLEPHISLLQLIRDVLGLMGTKEGCGNGNCGACSVILDGVLVNSCCVLGVEANGREVTTIEGLTTPNGLHPLQQQFLDHAALQCGICAPGFIIAAKALLDKNPFPTEHQVRYWMAGNLCRCTGYDKIIRAVLDAAQTMKARA